MGVGGVGEEGWGVEVVRVRGRTVKGGLGVMNYKWIAVGGNIGAVLLVGHASF